MGKYSNAQGNFLGGYFSPSARGRWDDPQYPNALAECLNGYPIEEGSWNRRAGFRSIGYTYKGLPAKLLPLAGANTVQYNIELSEGIMRVANGMSMLTDGNLKGVTAFSADNPAIVTTDVPHEWVTGDHVAFDFQTAAGQYKMAAASNRLFEIERVDATNFKLHDFLTGAGFDGSTITYDATLTTNVAKILVMATPWTNGRWLNTSNVQSDTLTLLLNPAVKPQTLTMIEAGPTSMLGTTLAPTDFVDGPYLDAVSGAWVTPDALSGLVNLTITYQTWDSTAVYSKGDVVVSSTAYYISLADANINQTPASSPLYWSTTSPSGFINQGLGVMPTDIGRHVRLLSEPPAWVSGTTYAVGDVVSFLTQTGGTAYWSALKSMAGASPSTGTINPNQPGQAADTWAPYASGARWTWGKVTSIDASSKIAFSGSPIGNMTGGPGLTALEGTTVYGEGSAPSHRAKTAYAGVHWGSAHTLSGARLQPASRASSTSGGSMPVGISGSAPTLPNGTIAFSTTQTGTLPRPPTTGAGINTGTSDYTFAQSIDANVRVSLYAKHTAPSNGTDGTLLGQTTLTVSQVKLGGAYITSNDQTTAWEYTWFYVEVFPVQNTTGSNKSQNAYSNPVIVASNMAFYDNSAQNGSTFQVQIIGKPLLYSTTIKTWRFGRYNATEPAWPTVGAYHEGRFWLASDKGHFDASMSGRVLVFSPTYEDGTVADDSGISYTLNSTVRNAFQWMVPAADGVTCGTIAGEFLISAPNNGIIAPTNIQVEITTEYGSAVPVPMRGPHALLFVHRNGRDVYEYMRDLYSGKLTAKSLTTFSKSLTSGGIRQLAYEGGTTAILWACTNRGRLVGTSYKRETRLAFQPPTYNAWHRHNHGANRLFLSISTAPSRRSGLDRLMAVTQSKDTGYCRLEVMGDELDENATVFDCAFLDGALIQTSGLVGGLPGSGSQITPPDPPPPPAKSWKVSGYHLSLTCPAVTASTYPPSAHIISTCYHPAADAEPLVDTTHVFLAPPSSIAFGTCGIPGFTTAGQTPGVDVFMPAAGQPFTIAQYISTLFGADKWARYQVWVPDVPGVGTPATPTWS